MSSQIIALNNGQQAIINTDTSNLFLWNRRSEKGILANSTYGAVTILAGTVMGRISATGRLAVMTSGASNGSQIPVGVLLMNYTLDASSEREVFIVDDGDVAADKLIFQGSDTLNTVVAGSQYRDYLKRLGIKVINAEEMTEFDNS